VVLDVVAGHLVGEGLPLLRDGSRWVVAGALGGHSVAFDVRRLYLHNIQIIGSSMHTPAHFDLLMSIARQGQVQPVIATTFPWTRPPRRKRNSAGETTSARSSCIRS
jgi:NADPH:quinone reductase-like Zn-dependent oxidoreductase